MQIDVQCPVCKVNGSTTVPDYLLEKAKSGVVAVQVVMKEKCPHAFIAFVDQNGGIRGYQVLDYHVELETEKTPRSQAYRPETIQDIHEILGVAAIGHLLAALSTDTRVYLVGDLPTASSIADYFDRILPKSVPRTLLQPITKQDITSMMEDQSSQVTIDLESRAILGTPFSAKQTEWFCAPISKALEMLNPKEADIYLEQSYLQIWNRLNILRHLLTRAKQRGQGENS